MIVYNNSNNKSNDNINDDNEKLGFKRSKMWYDRIFELVFELEGIKILWGFKV